MEQRESDGNSEHDVDEIQEAPVDGKRCAEKETGKRATSYSMVINNAFNFLCDDDDDDGHSPEGATREQVLASTEEDDRTSPGTDNQLTEETQSASDSSVSSGLLRKTDLGQSEPGQSSDDRQSAVEGNGQEYRPSRIISGQFKFLFSDKYASNGHAEDCTLPLVKEAEPEEKQLKGTDVAEESILPGDTSATIQHKIIQTVRNSEAANLPSSSDSEEDDCDGHVDPGAWTRSTFVYIDKDIDTRSEEITAVCPQQLAKQSDCSSIYPPTISNVEEENSDTAGCECHNDVFESDIKHVHDTKTVLNERPDSVSTTQSEQEFRTNFRTLKKTRILRNHSLSRTEKIRLPSSPTISQELVLKLNEGEKEFGFHVWGRAPMIVSTIEEGSAADRAGLKVGDVLLRINSFDISEASVNEVVDILGKDSLEVRLGISGENLKSELPLYCSYLIKQGGSVVKNWRRRWVELKTDHCLYYYKKKGDLDPLGAVPVINYTVTKATEVNEEFAFKLIRYGSRTYYFIASSEAEMSGWADAISKASIQQNEHCLLLDISSHNVSLPALAIRHPDCFGYLTKMGNCRKSWRHRYCILKDGCLFYYSNVNSPTAKGVVHLHGYSVSNSMPHNKPHGFMLVPPESDMRTFYFFASNEDEKQRWVTAFRESLSRWMAVTE